MVSKEEPTMSRDLLVDDSGQQRTRPAIAWFGRLRGRERQLGLHAGLWLALFLFLLWKLVQRVKGNVAAGFSPPPPS